MSADLEEDSETINKNLINEAYDLMTKGRSLISEGSHNQEAFELFSKAKELNPQLIDAWIELTNCHERNGDIGAAISCLEDALKHSDPDKPNKIILRTLSAFIRQQVGKNCDSQEVKIAALLNSLDLSKKALKLDLHDADSYYNLAKAYMCLFFVTECVDQQLINLSKAAFAKALDLSSKSVYTEDVNQIVLEEGNLDANVLKPKKPFENQVRPFIEQSDFLFNYSSVLIYLQEFQKALEYLRLAIKWDPDWDEPKLLEECLVDYLRQIYSMMHEMSKNNKRIVKRYNKVVESLKNVEKVENFIQFDQRRLFKSQDTTVKSFTIKDLKNMQYHDIKMSQNTTGQPLADRVIDSEVKLLHLRLVNTINYNQAMYLTFVAIDRDYSLVVVTIYNLAESRCPTARDLVTIVDPRIEEVTVDNLTTKEKDCKLAFGRINVREFKSLYVNGCRITIDQVSKPQFRVSLLP